MTASPTMPEHCPACGPSHSLEVAVRFYPLGEETKSAWWRWADGAQVIGGGDAAMPPRRCKACYRAWLHHESSGRVLVVFVAGRN